MASEEGSDSMRMWGFLLRFLRIAAGITYEELSVFVGYSKSLIVGIERGTRMPSAVFVAKADECLGAGGMLVEAAAHLSRQRFLSWFEEYAEAEKRARMLWTYDTHVLHGMLQSEDYARAVLAARCPMLTEEEIEEHFAGLMERRELLTRQPGCALSFVVEEWVLRRAIGGPAVMAGQLRHLAGLCERRNITVQVMPLSYESHAGVDGPLTLLEMPEHIWLAYLEVQGTGHLIDEPGEVSALHERYSMIRSQALTPRDSLRFIRSLAEEMSSSVPAAERQKNRPLATLKL